VAVLGGARGQERLEAAEAQECGAEAEHDGAALRSRVAVVVDVAHNLQRRRCVYLLRTCIWCVVFSVRPFFGFV